MTRGNTVSVAAIASLGVVAGKLAGLAWTAAALLGALPVAIALGGVALVSAVVPTHRDYEP